MRKITIAKIKYGFHKWLAETLFKIFKRNMRIHFWRSPSDLTYRMAMTIGNIKVWETASYDHEVEKNYNR